MAKRYKDGLATKLIPVLAEFFGNFNQNLNFLTYCDGLEKMFNKDEHELKKFAFKIFDVTHDKKLSENDMFELMKMTSAVKGGYFNNPELERNQEIIPLNKQKDDLFLDIFSREYI